MINRKHVSLTVLILLVSLSVILGCAVGLIICIELLRQGKVYVFLLYDLFSFIIALVFGVGSWYRKICDYAKGKGTEEELE
jgi:hypothetical protein